MPQAPAVMLIVAGPVGDKAHDVGAHPERPARITAVMQGLADLHLRSAMALLAPRRAEREALLRVHHAAYLDALESLAGRGGGPLDADTFVAADSWEAALRAAGAGLDAVDALRERGDGVAFALARPPGHHAEPERGMGFCLLNNVAVAASAIVAAGERVLIVDWDVHHGNGTQDIFWDEPQVLYVSTHQSPLFPGTGQASEIGGSAAPGTTVNVPLPPGATGDVLRLAFDDVVAPVVDAFAPDWVLVSCGFDAHRADPLAELALTSADFAALARTVSEFVPGPGRLVLFLEGGYDLVALRRSTAATLGALLGTCHLGPEGPDGAEPIERPTSGGPGADAVRAAAAARRDALDAAFDS